MLSNQIARVLCKDPTYPAPEDHIPIKHLPSTSQGMVSILRGRLCPEHSSTLILGIPTMTT